MKKIVFLLAALTAASAFAAADIFIGIAGIKGESQDAAHKDWIEALSFSQNANPFAASAYREATFKARAGTWVASLQRAVATGQHYPTVTVDTPSTRFNFSDVIFKSLVSNTPDVTVMIGYKNFSTTPLQKPATPVAPSAAATPFGMGAMTRGSTQLFVDGAPTEQISVIGGQVVKNTATLKLREPAKGFFEESAARGKRSNEVKFLQYKFETVVVTSVRTESDGSKTVTLNFGHYDGPPTIRP